MRMLYCIRGRGREDGFQRLAWMAVVTSLLLSPLLGPAHAYHAYAAGAGAGGSRTPGQVALVIDDFEMLKGKSRFGLLERSLAEIVQVALIPYEEIKLIGRDELWQALRGLKVPASEFGERRVFKDDVLRKAGAEYVVSGVFLQFERTVQVRGVLREVSSSEESEETEIGPVSMRVEEIFAGMEEFTEKLVATLVERGALGYSVPRVAVMCFSNLTDKGEVSLSLRRDLAITLAAQLSSHEGIRVIGWNDIKEYCDAAPDVSELAKVLHADAVVSGGFDVREDHVSIVVNLSIPSLTWSDKIAAIEGDIDAYLDLRQKLAGVVGETFVALVTSDGQFNKAWLSQDAVSAEGNLEFGVTYYEKGEFDVAAIYLQRAVDDSDGPLPEAEYLLGRVRLYQERYEDAKSLFERVIGLSGRFLPEAYKGLGEAYLGLGQNVESIAAFEEAIALQPEEAIALEPDYRDAYDLLGYTHILQGDYDAAKTLFLDRVRRDPMDVYTYQMLGAIEQEQGNDKGAIQWYLRTLELEPKNSVAREKLGSLFANRGWKAFIDRDFHQAIESFTREIKYTPSARAFYDRGVSYGSLRGDKNYAKAAGDYNEAWQLAERDFANYKAVYVDALHNLSEVYILRGKYEDTATSARHLLGKLADIDVEDRDDVNLARYLLVLSLVLDGKDHSVELKILRRGLSSYGWKSSDWTFKYLEDWIEKVASVDADTRELFLSITREMKEARLLVSKSGGIYEVWGATKIDAATAKVLSERGVVFVDVRDAGTYGRGHIPGAAHLDLTIDLNVESLSQLIGKDDEVVFYCFGESCYMSADACAKALTWGFTRVYYFAGGFPAWKAAGYPVEVD